MMAGCVDAIKRCRSCLYCFCFLMCLRSDCCCCCCLSLTPSCALSVTSRCRLRSLRQRPDTHITHHTSHVTCHKSHVTRHTSHITRHTSHHHLPTLFYAQVALHHHALRLVLPAVTARQAHEHGDVTHAALPLPCILVTHPHTHPRHTPTHSRPACHTPHLPKYVSHGLRHSTHCKRASATAEASCCCC